MSVRNLCAAAVAAAVFAAGCSSRPTVPQENMDQVNSILDEVSAQYAEEGARRCLSSVSFNDVDIVNEHRVIFRGVGARAWLNDLRHRCPGLRRGDTLAIEQRDSRACEFDTVTVIDEFNLERKGATCTLGVFKPIPPAHSKLIDELMRGKVESPQ